MKPNSTTRFNHKRAAKTNLDPSQVKEAQITALGTAEGSKFKTWSDRTSGFII